MILSGAELVSAQSKDLSTFPLLGTALCYLGAHEAILPSVILSLSKDQVSL
jgi:hypothetical protein